MIKYIIFSSWSLLIIGWNYYFTDSTPFDDVFVTICLFLFAKSLEKRFDG